MSNERFAREDLRINFMHFGGFAAPHLLTCDFVVVDFETTGLDATQGARVIEVAAHRTRGDGRVLDSFVTLVNPAAGPDGTPGGTGAVHIHGITSDSVREAPTFPEIWPELSAFLSDAVFVAHHAWFDASFLAAEISANDLTADWMPALCTYWLARQAFPHLQRHNLEAVGTALGIVNRKPHDAASDALVVVELLPELLGRVQPVRHYVAPVPRSARPSKTARLLTR